MFSIKSLRALAAALPLVLSTFPAFADIKDYEFQLIQKELKQGNGVIVTVRLIDKRTGKPVPDAVIFASRIDMEPDGMATMTSKLEPIPSPEPGSYSFRTNLIMEGGWRLSLGAKVQGEDGTIESRLVLKATP
ncbi:Conserved exported protein implied in the cusBA heavy metal efflux RND system [Bosea sp. 62]|uniref:FixH family protein n=1 Tax=unclassified Bosea (in: a-proteobacteria) TaxID=2653178 RepID=UPI001257B89D|nr:MULTISPECIES: FixH family protein [unclassified Bosea (in: a-proteobacteria)]CAD5292185.1 Conserved exported protein implied in the cusBA heavy metal efflux RND system [Bosea sp. 21B]CAD5293208.1 Conserved exported protein implied in the cusBA heavy metal efflux RND system [Bosea sp. 46]CAD5299762.1 Conserved exported protein implied in the cusBA heavy metal efflux RND system [Bosea sp. 7B]VVT57011.1 Conserved exported protein implied in the cusBA heavy metal efflux RND system [Bosea sp. EC-